jgi:hypothetical protein
MFPTKSFRLRNQAMFVMCSAALGIAVHINSHIGRLIVLKISRRDLNQLFGVGRGFLAQGFVP